MIDEKCCLNTANKMSDQIVKIKKVLSKHRNINPVQGKIFDKIMKIKTNNSSICFIHIIRIFFSFYRLLETVVYSGFECISMIYARSTQKCYTMWIIR